MGEDKEKWTVYRCIICEEHNVAHACSQCGNWACATHTKKCTRCNKWFCTNHITVLSTGNLCASCAGT